MRERWVVISNCQAFGLANGISAVARSIECDAFDAWQVKDLVAQDPNFFRAYDFALILPEAREMEHFPADAMPPSIDVPAFMFGAYHPDCCYVFVDDVPVNGLVGPYHSMIALASFKEEKTPAEAARWFNAALYRKAGYHLHWAPHRDHMISAFRNHGLEIAPLFRKMSRGRPFMHTSDHPTMELMLELARVVLTQFGHACHTYVPVPSDNLAITSYPVYPEIAELLGVRGDYRFTPAGRYAAVGLDEFLEHSFATFAAWHKSELRVMTHSQRRFRHIRSIIRGEA